MLRPLVFNAVVVFILELAFLFKSSSTYYAFTHLLSGVFLKFIEGVLTTVYFIAREWTWCWVSTLHLLPPSSKSPLNCFYRSGCCSTETKCFKKDQQQIASSRCEITQIYNRKGFKNKHCYARMNLIVWLKLTFSMIIYGPLCDQADLHLNDLNKKVSMM